MTLEPYSKKRDFARTREPTPAPGDARRGPLRFVVQKHAARRLHYDFRLEWDGALKSWAVPQGPSLDNSVKRLAVLVEDHPLDYAAFEGVIADGNYGAGEVIVWDTGAYSPDEDGVLSFGDRDDAEERMRQGFEKGKLSFTLRGHKLRGSWTLVRTSRGPKDWLLIKHRDAETSKDRDVLEDERSVLSGLTVEELTAGKLPDPSKSTIEGRLKRLGPLAVEAPFPEAIKPMMARLGDRPFSHRDWLFEPKLDGYRIIAFLRGGQARLMSRNGQDYTGRFHTVAADLSALLADDLVLDGEVVALGEDGLPSFALLQQQMERPGAVRIAYYPFDVLYVHGKSVLKAPLAERKELLSLLVPPSDGLRAVQHVDADGETFFQAAANLGLEGMIAKRKDSTYQPGSRAETWAKIKTSNAQEFVIGGYTPGEGWRASTFGALILGYYAGDKLHYAGKVGTGFDDHTLGHLHELLHPLTTRADPFMPDEELSKLKVAWVKPEIVAQVKFSDWTDDGRLRAPVFLGLRDDKDPKSVVREPAEEIALPDAPGKAEQRARGKEPVVARPDGRASARGVVPRRAPSPHAEKALEEEKEAVLAQLESAGERVLVEIAGHRIGLTNLNKPLWPAVSDRAAVTKREFISYYVRMSPWLLPHLKDRVLTFTRYPNGIDGGSFYQKHADLQRPSFVETVRLFSSHNEGERDFILANNLATLVWLAQLGTIELHPWLSRSTAEGDSAHLPKTFTGSKEEIESSVLHFPDFIVFDLDPYIYSGSEKAGEEPELNRKAFRKVVEVARHLKEVLDQLSLSSYVKTSGKTGLHIYVPVLRQYDFTATRKACELIGRFLMRQLPRDMTMEWSVDKRAGKIFLDHNQNVRGKNMASIYSLRPAPGAPVSTPVRWDELDTIYPTDFTIENVPGRVADLDDLWSDILDAKHDLKRLLEA